MNEICCFARIAETWDGFSLMFLDLSTVSGFPRILNATSPLINNNT